MPRLAIESGPLRGRVLDLPAGRRVGIGRGDDCVVSIPDERVSRLHCEIVPHKGHFVLVDHKSRNGTLVNRSRVDKTVLRPGDMIGLGSTYITFLDEQGDPLIGKTVGGYRIIARVGRGGMGTVYRAHQLALKREVAFKVLAADIARDPELVTQFITEARAAAKLDHPNVVRVFDVGSAGDVHFMSMEFMAGGSLQHLLDTQGPIPIAKALAYMADACEALVWAQELAIVHRDIKPDNLMLDGAGTLKIGDFGIASDRTQSKTIYRKGAVIGTPHHMSPEQAEGREVDHRTDLYALGSTLYTILSGKPPYDGETALEVLLKKVRNSPPPTPLAELVRGVPPVVDAVVSKLMAHGVEDRYPTAQSASRAIRAALARIDSSPGPGAAASGEEAPEEGATSSRRGLFAALGGAALVLVIGLVWALSGNGDAPQDAGLSDSGGTPPAGVVTADPGAGEAPGGKPTADSSVTPAVGEPPASATADSGATTGASSVKKTTIDPLGDSKEARETRAALKEVLIGMTEGAMPELEAHTRFSRLESSLGEEWKEIVDDIELRLLAHARAGLAGFVEAEIDSTITAGEFATARSRLETHAAQHPFVAAEIEAKSAAIDAAAEKALATALEATMAAEKDGDFDTAVATLERLSPKLTAAALEGAQGELASLSSRRAEFQSQRDRLDKLQKTVRENCRALELDAALSAIEEIDGALHPANEALRERLRRSVDEFKLAHERVTSGLEELTAKSYAPLALRSDPVGAVIDRRVRSVSGLDVELQARGSSTQTVRATDLVDAVLLRFMAGEATAADTESIAALGTFLHYAGGPAPAIGLLEARNSEGAFTEALARLSDELSRTVLHDLTKLLVEIRALRDSPLKNAAEWQSASATASRIARDARELDDTTLLSAIALTFAECWVRVHGEDPERLLFRGKTSIRPGRREGEGLVARVDYDFRDEAQKRDFHIVGSSGAETRWRRGLLGFRGDLRLARGYPFRGNLKVTGIVVGADRDRPNISVAMWSHPNEQVSGRSYWSSQEGVVVSPLAIFSIGYYSDASGTYNGVPYLNLGGREISLPANVLLTVGRSGSKNSSRLSAAWARRPGRRYPDPLPFEVAIDESGQATWNAAGDRATPRDLGQALGADRQLGSVTIASPDREVALQRLLVEGELDRSWVDDEIARAAANALAAIDSRHPIRNSHVAFERSVRKSHRIRSGTPALFDGFDGGAALKWSILGDTPGHRGFSAKPGALSIRTKSGDFIGAVANAPENVHLTDIPAGTADFDLGTRLVGFRPSSRYQQAGLLCYVDGKNFIRGLYKIQSSGRVFVLERVTEGRASTKSVAVEGDVSTVWLRLQRRGTLYSLWTSLDGIAWDFVGEVTWGAGTPRQAGLIAINGNRTESERSAHFDFFELTKSD